MAGAQDPSPQPAAAPRACVISGSVTAGQARLPGVAITVERPGGQAPLVTSSGLDGRYAIDVPGPGEYTLKADLAAFAPVTQTITVGATCQATADFALTLASRAPVAETPPGQPAAHTPAGQPPAAGDARPPGAAPLAAATPATGTPPVTSSTAAQAATTTAAQTTPAQAAATTGATPATPGTPAQPAAPARPGAGARPSGAPGQQAGASGQQPGAAGQRRPQAPQFQTLPPMMDPAARGTAATGDAETLDRDAAAQLSLPPGFSIETSAESVTAVGSSGQMNAALLFGMMGEGPMGREGPGMGGMPGDTPGGEMTPGGSALGPAGAFGGFGGLGGMGGIGGPGGDMGPGMGGGRGMGGGPGAMGGGPGLARLAIAGRLAGNRPRGMVNYTVGGSALNAAPYALAGQPVDEPGFLQQRFGANLGGPLKIPGLFDWSRNTNFFLNYTGNHSGSPHDSYSTVPTAAMRAGDLSSLGVAVIDPRTGLPFAGGLIPSARLDAAALALLQHVPLPNLPGDRQNFYYSTTTSTHRDDVNIRIIRMFGATQRQPGAQGPAARGGPGGRMGGRGAAVNLGVRYSRSSNEQRSAFPSTGGSSKRSAWDVPLGVSFSKWGLMNSVRFQFNRSRSTTANRYAFSQDLSGDAGIAGVSREAFDWGLPNLSFSSLTSLRDTAPSQQTDRTITLGVTMAKLRNRHTVRWGGDVRFMATDSRLNTNPRGTFVFTGLYTGGSGRQVATSGLDFADFLLGLPQQATVQYGPGLTRFRGLAWSAFVQDDWRVTSRFTVNAGLRYEYLSPYRESGNNLVTLDVTPGFTAAAPVFAGQSGPYSGPFAPTIVRPDRNNLAPRVGFAWRPRTRTTVRGGFGVSYSSPVYFAMVQRLAGQPPFAVTDTRLGTAAAPVSLSGAFATPNPAQTTNNFAVDPGYQLGRVLIWNLDAQRDLGRTFMVAAGYTGTKGSTLDLQRAPNRGPSGLTIPGVLPFIWESSDGRSIMHALNLRLRKRMSAGVSGGITYTFSKSMDDASTIGGGAVVVAQDDRNLDAEWGLSSFDQRHRLTADATVALPFGPGRRWLNRDGAAAAVLGGWVWTASANVSSGSPFTARVLSSSADAARGTYGTLRANYTGQPIAVSQATIARFFNTDAFSVPESGTFGNAGRNTITGPGSVNVNMSLMKSVSLGGSRTLVVRAEANNVLNMAQFGAIDTAVNSPTFGRVVSMRPMRAVQIVTRVTF